MWLCELLSTGEDEDEDGYNEVEAGEDRNE